jgi:hypothetical protein
MEPLDGGFKGQPATRVLGLRLLAIAYMSSNCSFASTGPSCTYPNVRGWAAAPQGLEKVELYVDYQCFSNIPLDLYSFKKNNFLSRTENST